GTCGAKDIVKRSRYGFAVTRARGGVSRSRGLVVGSRGHAGSRARGGVSSETAILRNRAVHTPRARGPAQPRAPYTASPRARETAQPINPAPQKPTHWPTSCFPLSANGGSATTGEKRSNRDEPDSYRLRLPNSFCYKHLGGDTRERHALAVESRGRLLHRSPVRVERLPGARAADVLSMWRRQSL